MYVRFKILTIKPLLGEKALVIESTHEIDAQTVQPQNIRITRPGDPIEELLWQSYDIKGKCITLYLEEQPLINERYIVRIKHLKNIIDDELETHFSQSVVFESYTRSEITFVKPVMHSILQALDIQLEEKVFEGQQAGANAFEYELSSDPLFLSNEALIDKQMAPETHIQFDLGAYQGQLFIRCRAHYIQEASDSAHYSDWITTTCLIDPNQASSSDNNESATHEPLLQLALEVIDTPANNTAAESFAYVFDTQDLTSVESVTVVAKPLDGKSAELILTSYEILMNNMLVIVPQVPLPKNSLITVHIKNARAEARVLKDYKHQFYSVLEPCYGDIKDIEALLDLGITLDPQLVYYHLIEASKLADYYAQIKLNSAQKNFAYYHKVENAEAFEKAMFVKYYAANQILSQVRARLAYNASFSGKLGEIEYTPKGALPDLTGVLKGLLGQADAWKLALQGYKDHPADATSVIKAIKCYPHNHDRGRI